MVVLGIDPGSRNLGYSLINYNGKKSSLIEAGLIKIRASSLQEQLLDMSRGLESILKERSVDEVAMESIFFAHNPKSVIKLAQFRGAIGLKIVQTVGHFYEYTPLEIKRAVTGNGKATKEQVAFMVKRLLNIRKEIKPYDITDAMAVALTHIQRIKVRCE
jgi:crossover junction endodeoxyribonuclease RuvC